MNFDSMQLQNQLTIDTIGPQRLGLYYCVHFMHLYLLFTFMSATFMVLISTERLRMGGAVVAKKL